MKKKKKPVKKNRRNAAKNSSLDPAYTIKSRLEYLDYDYTAKLNAKELAWLAKFTEEELHASFSDNNSENLNKTPEEKRVIYNRNNTRNADILTRKKTRKQLDYLSEKHVEKATVDSTEDYLIAEIDRKKFS